jgi:cation:H+ antiporter
MGDAILLLASFAVILAGALVFTNAIEWAGHRLDLGQGAVGSILAAVGTAMPETLIPIVAILEGDPGSKGVAIGAIVGAPFLLATIAMMLVGLSALAYSRRRPQGRSLRAHGPTLERDLLLFLPVFACGLLLGLGTPAGLQVAAAIALVAAYLLYVRTTLRHGGEAEAIEEIAPLILARSSRADEDAMPSGGMIVMQIAVGLAAIVGGAHLFVEELVHVAEEIGVEALVLSLVLAPLATELPEKANSFFWVREGKDSLALGNITGAMVFQSTVPVAVGLAFTDWDLDRFAVLSMVLGLAGGAIAYGALHRARRFSAPAILAWGALYAAFLVYVLAAA